MGVIDPDLQVRLAISTQETAFNVALVYWSRLAKGYYMSQTCSCHWRWVKCITCHVMHMSRMKFEYANMFRIYLLLILTSWSIDKWHVLMCSCKKDVTPLLTHWSYVFLVLTHRYVVPFLCLGRNNWNESCPYHALLMPWLCFYQTRSAWSRDQGSNRKHSAVHNFAPTVTKFCVMWEGQALPHDTKFSNCRCEIVGRRVIFIWSLIPGSSWSGLIKAEPGWGTLDAPLCMRSNVISFIHHTIKPNVYGVSVPWLLVSPSHHRFLLVIQHDEFVVLFGC